jgi:hypothetical protein
MAMTAVTGIKQTQDKQWPASSDYQEGAERATHNLRILIIKRHCQDRPIRDEHRGALLDTYG